MMGEGRSGDMGIDCYGGIVRGEGELMVMVGLFGWFGG
jgi:hypothetical protein